MYAFTKYFLFYKTWYDVGWLMKHHKHTFSIFTVHMQFHQIFNFRYSKKKKTKTNHTISIVSIIFALGHCPLINNHKDHTSCCCVACVNKEVFSVKSTITKKKKPENATNKMLICMQRSNKVFYTSVWITNALSHWILLK